jgi:hypothetical protein
MNVTMKNFPIFGMGNSLNFSTADTIVLAERTNQNHRTITGVKQ